MKFTFKFSNLLGAIYKQGSVLFSLDGNCIYSPVGNRVSKFDLKNNKSCTFPFENGKNIHRIAVSPDGVLMITIDEDGKALLINLHHQAVLCHFNFKTKVHDIKFSPNGKYIAVTHDKSVHIWYSPGQYVDFAPFQLYYKFHSMYDNTRCIDWSDDSLFIAVGSRDMSCRIYSIRRIEGYRYVNLLGHRSSVLGCFFGHRSLDLYTVSKDGAVIVWECDKSMEDINDVLVGMDEMDSPPLSLATTTATTTTPSDHRESIEDDDGDGYDIDGDDSLENAKKAKRDGEALNFIKWRKVTKHLYSQERARVTCCVLHKHSKTLITGFNNGVFTLHEMPDFNKIHALNMSDRAITSVAVNRTGEWLAFGCQSMGQLLVWEWQSETYILKQQSHFNDMNCMCYSPDGHVIATGGDDGKVKLWDTSSGFCFATFNEHSAAVTAVCITSNGKVVVSASLDGTVRAFDLQRYRNFRTMVSPRPVQFTSLAVDVSGEVISAGSHDTFEIFIWSLKTGRLLEILSGHEGPVSSLSFSPTLSVLASSSWDKTVKLWDVFENKGNVETFTFLSDVQALTYSPDGTQLAVSTLDGVISLWDVSSSSQVGSIEGKNDLEVGRSSADRITAKRLSENAFFTCLCYTVDGQNLLAGGKSKYVCLYDTNHQQLLKKFQTSHNKSLDGLSQFLNSRKMTEAGPLEMISDEERDSDEEKSLIPLPGVMKGDYSSRKEHPVIRTKSLQFSPTGKAWAAVTTEGLMVFTIEAGILFNPYDLTVDLTPDIVRQAIHDREYTHALVMSIRLNEPSLILESIEQVPPTDVELVLRGLPQVYIEHLLPFLSDQVYSSPHIGYYMAWCTKLLSLYTQTIKSNSRALLSSITDLQKSISQRQSDLGQICDPNLYGLRYLVSMMDAAASLTPPAPVSNK